MAQHITFGGSNFKRWDTFQPSCTPPRPPAERLVLLSSVHLLDVCTRTDDQFVYVPDPTLGTGALTSPAAPVANGGADNEAGDYILLRNDILGTQHEFQYRVVGKLGQGTFGQVVKCVQCDTKELVAVKVVKNRQAFAEQALVEAQLLSDLNDRFDAREKHLVRLLDNFDHRGHKCLVFPLLDVNLYELLRATAYRGVTTPTVQQFTRQMLEAVAALDEANIIHCDLKPENIMLERKSKMIKHITVIDFGSGCYEGESSFPYIQSRHYRSPEVILGIRQCYTSAIDVWSLACIAVELFCGIPLFPGVHAHNQLSRIIDTCGEVPRYMLEHGTHTRVLYNVTQSGDELELRFKTPQEYAEAETGGVVSEGKSYYNYTKLHDIIMNNALKGDAATTQEKDKEMQQRELFAHFLEGLLRIDPTRRWTAAQALLHPFVTGADLIPDWEPPPMKRKAADAFTRLSQENDVSAIRRSCSEESPPMAEAAAPWAFPEEPVCVPGHMRHPSLDAYFGTSPSAHTLDAMRHNGFGAAASLLGTSVPAESHAMGVPQFFGSPFVRAPPRMRDVGPDSGRGAEGLGLWLGVSPAAYSALSASPLSADSPLDRLMRNAHHNGGEEDVWDDSLVARSPGDAFPPPPHFNVGAAAGQLPRAAAHAGMYRTMSGGTVSSHPGLGVLSPEQAASFTQFMMQRQRSNSIMSNQSSHSSQSLEASYGTVPQSTLHAASTPAFLAPTGPPPPRQPARKRASTDPAPPPPLPPLPRSNAPQVSNRRGHAQDAGHTLRASDDHLQQRSPRSPLCRLADIQEMQEMDPEDAHALPSEPRRKRNRRGGRRNGRHADGATPTDTPESPTHGGGALDASLPQGVLGTSPHGPLARSAPHDVGFAAGRGGGTAGVGARGGNNTNGGGRGRRQQQQQPQPQHHPRVGRGQSGAVTHVTDANEADRMMQIMMAGGAGAVSAAMVAPAPAQPVVGVGAAFGAGMGRVLDPDDHEWDAGVAPVMSSTPRSDGGAGAAAGRGRGRRNSRGARGGRVFGRGLPMASVPEAIDVLHFDSSTPDDHLPSPPAAVPPRGRVARSAGAAGAAALQHMAISAPLAIPGATELDVVSPRSDVSTPPEDEDGHEFGDDSRTGDVATAPRKRRRGRRGSRGARDAGTAPGDHGAGDGPHVASSLPTLFVDFAPLAYADPARGAPAVGGGSSGGHGGHGGGNAGNAGTGAQRGRGSGRGQQQPRTGRPAGRGRGDGALPQAATMLATSPSATPRSPNNERWAREGERGGRGGGRRGGKQARDSPGPRLSVPGGIPIEQSRSAPSHPGQLVLTDRTGTSPEPSSVLLPNTPTDPSSITTPETSPDKTDDTSSSTYLTADDPHSSSDQVSDGGFQTSPEVDVIVIAEKNVLGSTAGSAA